MLLTLVSYSEIRRGYIRREAIKVECPLPGKYYGGDVMNKMALQLLVTLLMLAAGVAPAACASGTAVKAINFALEIVVFFLLFVVKNCLYLCAYYKRRRKILDETTGHKTKSN